MSAVVQEGIRADAERSATRLLHFGVAYGDFRRAAAAQDWQEWASILAQRGATYAAQGDHAAASGEGASAAESWSRAVACFHYAQFKLPPGERKSALRESVQSVYARCAPLLDPPAQALAISFDGASFPGYLRVPVAPRGCVLLVNGLDSAKEVELAHFAQGFLRRGFAVFYFDGPGHGLRPGGISMRRFSEMVGTSVDALQSRTELRGLPFGIFGVSFGGFLACHAAASEPRLQACISLGGFHDARILAKLPPPAHPAVRLAYGLAPELPLAELADVIDLQPLKGRLQKPLLVVHGSADHLVDAEQVEALHAWPAQPAQVRIYQGAEHVCTDRFGECLPMLWDWMGTTLGALPQAAPARTRLIDLSVTLDDLPSERVPVRVRRVLHREGAAEMSALFGVPADDLPDGLGWAGEEFTLITHAGTHMDAPWHYGPVSAGQPAAYIDQVPLDWCMAPGVVLDLRGHPDGHELTAEDVQASLARIPHVLSPGEIVLLHTGADATWGEAHYPEKGCGLGRAALLWLTAQGVRVIGTDAWGLDRPFGPMREAYQRSGDARVIWPTHFAGRERPYCQLEKLANLHLLPPTGFTVMCFPVKLSRAGAAWVRAVAMLDPRRGRA